MSKAEAATSPPGEVEPVGTKTHVKLMYRSYYTQDTPSQHMTVLLYIGHT